MPVINTVVERTAAWLETEEFNPGVREVSTVDLLPPTAYPQILVSVAAESFAPTGTAVTAEMQLTVSCAAGRPATALATVRSLAHQVRRSLNRSHCLGGLVKYLSVGEITFGRRDRAIDGGVIATAELELSLRYAADPLAD